MMRPRSRDAGISLILVVILFLITLSLVVASIILFANFKDKERIQAALDAEEKRLQDIDARIRTEMNKVVEPTGFVKKGEDQLPTIDAADRAKKVKEIYWTADRFGVFPLEGPKPLAPEMAKKFADARDGSSTFSLLQDQVLLATAWTFHYKNRFEQLELEHKIAQNQVKNREDIKPEVPKRKIEYNKLLSDRIQHINKLAAEEGEAYNARKAKLAEDRAKADAEAQVEIEKFAQDDIRYRNEIYKLKDDLEELKKKEVIRHEISFVHGTLLRPDVGNTMAFIDIGSRERVVPGLKFLVGKRGAQGKFDFKGKIEVKKAWMTYSEVAIIEVYNRKERPLVEGDFIVNPLFSKDRPLIVAFVGETVATKLRYSVDEAARRIREIGTDVRLGGEGKSAVDLDVDYIIFTEVSGKKQTREEYVDYGKAVFLEVPVAEASDIYRFLGD